MRSIAPLVLAVVLCVVGLSVAAQAEEPQGGALSGILVSKGSNWIEVRADGAAASVKYWPFWRGGADGGFDAAMLETIRKLVVPNRVNLTWQMEERPRIVNVTVVAPKEKSGTVVGTLTAKGETWIEVKPADGVPERYWPQWIGGMPSASGGFDKTMLATFAGLKVGDKVNVSWKYDERKRALEVHVVQ